MHDSSLMVTESPLASSTGQVEQAEVTDNRGRGRTGAKPSAGQLAVGWLD